jgi:hypothetical protein
MIGQIEIISRACSACSSAIICVGSGKRSGRSSFAPQFAGPRHPVEHDAVERELAAAIFLHHFDQLRLRFVTFLRLDVAERPLRQQRRLAGERAQLVHDAVELRPVNEVVIQLVVDIAPEVGAERVVVKGHQRITVQQHAVPARGDEHRHDRLHVLLVEILVLAAQVQHPSSCEPSP